MCHACLAHRSAYHVLALLPVVFAQNWDWRSHREERLGETPHTVVFGCGGFGLQQLLYGPWKQGEEEKTTASTLLSSIKTFTLPPPPPREHGGNNCLPILSLSLSPLWAKTQIDP